MTAYTYEINLDMDGTFVDLYGVDGWFESILAKDTLPYEIAKPLVNFSALARVLNNKIRKGYKVNIISWTANVNDDDYNKRIAEVKRVYLAKHLPSVKFNKINIVAYGTPKSTCGNGILFDDEKRNREEWGENAYDVENLIKKIAEIA